LVFTNGTPHSVHLSGMALKRKFNLPWIADFRDPWTKIDYFESMPLTSRSLRKHKQLEKEVVGSADICLTVSPSWRDDFMTLSARRAECITNGYDEKIESVNEKDFLISHVGSLHGDRSLDEVLIAFDLLVKKETAAQGKCKLVLVGNVNSETLQKINNNISSDRLILPGIVNHQEAKQWISKSSVLLLPINQTKDAVGRIPAKLFEYLSIKKPIAVLGTTEGDAANIGNETKSGQCFDQDEYKKLYEFFRGIRSQDEAIQLHFDGVDKYSRENTAKQLYTLIKSII